MVSYTQSGSYHSYGDHRQEPINQNHLLAVQKPPSKPSKKSQPPPSRSNQPRVYSVKPIHFRELVQRLTGASQPPPPSQRLQSAAPPPVQLAGHPNTLAAYASSNGLAGGAVKIDPSLMEPMPQDLTVDRYQKKPPAAAAAAAYPDGFTVGEQGMELSLSPTSCSWFSFPLLSPGPLSNFGA